MHPSTSPSPNVEGKSMWIWRIRQKAAGGFSQISQSVSLYLYFSLSPSALSQFLSSLSVSGRSLKWLSSSPGRVTVYSSSTFITPTSLQLSPLTQSTSEQGNPGLDKNVVPFISLFPSQTPIFVLWWQRKVLMSRLKHLSNYTAKGVSQMLPCHLFCTKMG